MPELPEVENYRRYFEAAALHQTITRLLRPDKRIIKHPIEEFEQAVVGRQFTGTTRVGKYLFAALDNDTHLLFHFGLTGDVKLVSGPDMEPRHTRVFFQLEGGACLAFIDPRKFGRLELVPDVDAYRKSKKIGPDAWGIDEETFLQSFERKTAPVKSLLLEQKHYAGIGNWIADEMLFRAGVNPEARANTVSKKKKLALHQHLQEILDVSVKVDTNYGNFPEGFFANIRSDKESCPNCGTDIKRIEVGGRGTYLCTSCQR